MTGQAIRPSWLLAFWAVAYATVFYQYQFQPVERILDLYSSSMIALVFVVSALILRVAEGAPAIQCSRHSKTFESHSACQWAAPSWMRFLGNLSVTISALLLVLVCLIVFSSGATTILGWQSAVDERFPSFGRIFLHLKQIGIPYLMLTAPRWTWRVASFCVLYVFGSLVYSFALGERVFFLETALLLLVAAMMRGWVRISVVRMALVGSLFIAVFMIVENAKKLIFSESQAGNLLENFSLISVALLERLLAYYGDPAAKFQFAISERLLFIDTRWFKDSIGIYLERAGVFIDGSSAVNEAYWSAGYGGPILTNAGGFTTFIVDFGPFFWLPISLFLILLVRAYRFSRDGSVAAACVYLMCSIAAIEMPRVAYVYWGRFWMPLSAMAVTYAIFRMASVGMRGVARRAVAVHSAAPQHPGRSSVG